MDQIIANINEFKNSIHKYDAKSIVLILDRLSQLINYDKTLDDILRDMLRVVLVHRIEKNKLYNKSFNINPYNIMTYNILYEYSSLQERMWFIQHIKDLSP